MIIINKGQDFQYKVNIKDQDGEEITVAIQNYYKVQIYTSDPMVFVDVTTRINTNNVLNVDYQLFSPLPSGQVHIKIMFSENNPDFYDGKYDYLKIINTEYFYDSEKAVYPEGQAQWGQIYGDITDQADLIGYIMEHTSDKDIVGLTQAEYDYMVANDLIKDNNLYIITDNN